MARKTVFRTQTTRVHTMADNWGRNLAVEDLTTDPHEDQYVLRLRMGDATTLLTNAQADALMRVLRGIVRDPTTVRTR